MTVKAVKKTTKVKQDKVNWIGNTIRGERLQQNLGWWRILTNVCLYREGEWWEAKNSSFDPWKGFAQVWGAVRQRSKKGRFGGSFCVELLDTFPYSHEVTQLPSHLSDIKSLFSRQIELKKFGRITVKGNEKGCDAIFRKGNLVKICQLYSKCSSPAPHFQEVGSQAYSPHQSCR